MKSTDIKHINAKICAQIEFALSGGHHVWLATDWHILRYDKLYKKMYERGNAAGILADAARQIGPEDVVIYMGDIIDSELYDTLSTIRLIRKLDTICSVFKKAKFKVLILGNNDVEDEGFYKSLGFDEIVRCIYWRDQYVISHTPFKCDNNHTLIHGHIHIGDPDLRYSAHFWKQYGVKKTPNMINVFNNERKLIDLDKDVLNDLIINGVPNDVEPCDTDKKPKKENAIVIKEARAYYKELIKK
jgi:calcineurin-like phosphoesterase family protein